LELIKKGATRMESYDIVQSAALRSYETGKSFEETLIAGGEIKKYMSDEDAKKCFDIEYHIRHVDEIFKNIGL